jgi:hypothetical protein
VNRIIAEASRGSKYYEMQVKKDRELTEKIEWFKAKVCKYLPWAWADSSATNLLPWRRCIAWRLRVIVS